MSLRAIITVTDEAGVSIDSTIDEADLDKLLEAFSQIVRDFSSVSVASSWRANVEVEQANSQSV